MWVNDGKMGSIAGETGLQTTEGVAGGGLGYCHKVGRI